MGYLQPSRCARGTSGLTAVAEDSDAKLSSVTLPLDAGRRHPSMGCDYVHRGYGLRLPNLWLPGESGEKNEEHFGKMRIFVYTLGDNRHPL